MGLVIEVLMLRNKSCLFSIIRTMITQTVMDTCWASLYQNLIVWKDPPSFKNTTQYTIAILTMVHCARCNSGAAPLISAWYGGRILLCWQTTRRGAMVSNCIIKSLTFMGKQFEETTEQDPHIYIMSMFLLPPHHLWLMLIIKVPGWTCL